MTSQSPSVRTSLLSLEPTTAAPAFRSRRTRRPSREPGPLRTRRPRRSLRRLRLRDLLSSWADPSAHAPRSSTPPDRSPKAITGRAMLPIAQKNTLAVDSLSFRGSITRLACSLCTFRRRARPRTAQHSVPAGDQPLAGGVPTRQVCYRRFQ